MPWYVFDVNESVGRSVNVLVKTVVRVSVTLGVGTAPKFDVYLGQQQK